MFRIQKSKLVVQTPATLCSDLESSLDWGLYKCLNDFLFPWFNSCPNMVLYIYLFFIIRLYYSL